MKQPLKASLDHWQKGVEFTETSRFDRALKEFSFAIEKDADWSLPFFWRGGVYERRNEFEKALMDFDRFVKLHEHEDENQELLAEAYAGRAYAYKMLGQLENALSDYSMELKLNPNSAIGYLDRSLVHNELGSLSEAKQDYLKAEQLDSSILELANGKPTLLSETGKRNREN